jgi:DNA-binding MarR family transcriptional regulator
MQGKTALPPFFAVFTEVGIIDQLATALLEARLPRGFLKSHFTVLNHLVRVADGRTPQELAAAFQLPKTTMTHTLRGLEAAGLVKTAPNPADGRSKCVWITEAGRAFRAQAIADLAPDVARIAAEFPPERLAPLLPELAALRAVMDRLRDAPPPRVPPPGL